MEKIYECNNENVEGSLNESIDEEKIYLEPCNGMEFNSHEEAYEFYLKYAKIIGFGILRKSSRRSKISNEFLDVKFVCTRSGSKRESITCNPRPYLKIDCKATLHLKRRLEGKWYVYNFIKEHNHESFDIACCALNDALDKCVKENHSISESIALCDGQKERSIHNLEVSKTKGAPKRIKSGLENSRKRKSNDKSKKGHAILKDKSTTCTDTLHLNFEEMQLKHIFLNDDECINEMVLNHLCTLTKNYLQIECENDYEALLYHYMIFMSYF
ncbi:hypothetical protein G4B88_014519 [Cannabis sativa]|uniref:FAR1 domain-containing protein n=1 Tax=Cannabis sativa TaxID=3483 RepID=A0A7J6I933_CANSA|nr:hypothetical protein G4B88_014519 [Cannabis sativa]